MLGLGKRMEALHGVSQAGSEETQREFKSWSKGLLVSSVFALVLLGLVIVYGTLSYKVEGVSVSVAEALSEIEAKAEAKLEAKTAAFFGELEAQMAAMEAKQQALQAAALQGALTEMSMKVAALKMQEHPEDVKTALAQIESQLSQLRQRAAK